MARNYSTTWRRKINSTSADESPLILLEVDHPSFDAPVRVVSDTQDLESNGEMYLASHVRVHLPDDREGQMPRARLAIDNVDGLLGALLEASGGGEGATVRCMEVLRSTPDVIEWETTLDLKSVDIAQMEIVSEIGYEDILHRPAVALTYRPDTAPGIF